ncbi:KH domain protein [Aspergillus sp. HF37]|nr:KH domain protein [Aspergillus sp. HF37]
MADEVHRPKRSRFDQKEPEPKRASRFDRRSRSPSSRQSTAARTRSPLSGEPRSPSTEVKKESLGDPAAAAAAAAAQINAQLQAKKGIQHADVPPIRSTASPAPKPVSPAANENPEKLNADTYVEDGDYIKDIEINDLRNRYMLTKGSTQKMINDASGADVTTRGNYYPDKNMSTAANPPLYLHVTCTNKEGLDRAVDFIDDLLKKELPNLVDERRFRRREPEQVERDEFGRRKWPEERILIDLEPIPGFNLRAQVVGQGGAYVKHIQQKTRCRVQIKGRGSGFVEQSTGREADEPMFLHVAGPDPNEVKNAKELCEDLMANVREQYQRFKENPPQHNYGGYGQRGDRYSYGGSYGGYASQPTPSSASPSGTPGVGGASGSPTDYSAQYAQYYGSDPYAAYGGYQNYVAYYQYYQQMAQQQQQQQSQDTAAPPPPPSSEAPPPPPGAGSPGVGGYGAVPPPPGL